ncbi:hypothetical protein [Aneurinibacillus migulanus]|uniref:Uncharacterized protein n=1 Tax=Aneurinibacillus migulanus TaxID=47500 RepID=A0A0D1VZB5_ANEMI|nr:hypothetical protein [Aneurinibacillus migulanus]KIV51515.1 hypothetical protein TS65_27250 [Aneurinibacillus migulanus]KON97588.1 hypothetical protein AF333_21150 [Aneurinibacillus migulanus]MED0896734.1 hypothetical protein [Aneurinibacillus migulanus]MED1619858.1 hypothetical protein [Aneurinibacillus migulanus]SDK52815.1 hypothetical protein SAMN04487909_1662 [Aneurinibacillus migulanus]
MDSFIKKIDAIKKIECLITIKEEIKDQIMVKESWQVRMELYKQIDVINQRIKEIEQTSDNFKYVNKQLT